MKTVRFFHNRDYRISACRRIGRSTVCLLMVSVIFWMVCFYFSPVASAAAPSGAGTVEFYKWTKTSKTSDLPKDSDHYAWFVTRPDLLGNRWGLEMGTTTGNYNTSDNNVQRKGVSYALRCECLSEGGTLNRYFDCNASVFYTPYAHGMLKMQYVGPDSGRSYLTNYYFRLNGGMGDYIKDLDDNDTNETMGFTSSVSKWCLWGIGCGGDGSNYGSKDYRKVTNSDEVVVVHNDSGAYIDSMWVVTSRGGTRVIAADENNKYTRQAPLMLWIGEKITFSAFTTDYLVEPGDVCNLDGNVTIMPGVTVTVAPGAVLSVEGLLYQNGAIKNYGTVIVQEKAAISPFFPEAMTADYGNATGVLAGTLQCINSDESRYLFDSGDKVFAFFSEKKIRGEGKVIVMKEGKLMFESGYGDLELIGGEVYNYGFVGTANLLKMTGEAKVVNKYAMMIGYDYSHLNEVCSSSVSVGSTISITCIKCNYQSVLETLIMSEESTFINDGVAYICMGTDLSNTMKKSTRLKGTGTYSFPRSS